MTSSSDSSCLMPTTKLRCLPGKETHELINILNQNNCWKELAGVITHPDNAEELLFTTDNISTLEMQWKSGSSPSEALILYWSTYGRKQPTIIDLIKFLKKANLLRAIMFVKDELLKNYSGNLLMDDDDEDILKTNKMEEKEFSEVDFIAKALKDVDLEELTLFSYQSLQSITNNFNNSSPDEGGSKIGEGAYGSVYKGRNAGGVVAVKKLKDPIDRQFITELTVLTRFKHENLLPLLGWSINGPSCCLVYEYMINGSLQERLACVGDSTPIPWPKRVDIAYGSAVGLNHLHTFGEKPMVHRDVKSANILLDANFTPKVGDFGLVRIGSSNISSSTAITENVYGTCVYMAREAYCGDVSIKLDSFSFGVVLLELLTGLPPFDVTREDRDLVTYMENYDNIVDTLDPKILWNQETASELYRISKLCLSESKRARPSISQVLVDLKNCLSNNEDN